MRSSRIMTVVGIQIVCVDTELERWRRLPLGLQLHALGYGLGCVPHGGRIVGRQCYQCVHLKIRIFLPKCGYIKQDSILKKLAFETDLISINELWSKCRRNVSPADWCDGDNIVPPRLESTVIFPQNHNPQES